MRSLSFLPRFIWQVSPWACALLISTAIAHAAPATSPNDDAVPAPGGCALQLQSTSAQPAAQPADVAYMHWK